MRTLLISNDKRCLKTTLTEEHLTEEDPIHINEEGATILASAIEKDACPTPNDPDAKTKDEETHEILLHTC